MWVLFRPGPYICGEWDFGGLPSRLLKDNIVIRSSDSRYLSEVEKYLSAIAREAEPFLAKHGGPILLTQIENEYGSWPFKDVAYLTWLKKFWKERGFGPFYMADGAGDAFLNVAVGTGPILSVCFLATLQFPAKYVIISAFLGKDAAVAGGCKGEPSILCGLKARESLP